MTAIQLGRHERSVRKSAILLAYSPECRNGKNEKNSRVASLESFGSLAA
jgi:hypothetical protein